MLLDQNVVRLIKTAKGQLNGILKMIEENRDCLDISTQIMASQSILKRANIGMLRNYLSESVEETFAAENKFSKQKKLDEIAEILDRVLK